MKNVRDISILKKTKQKNVQEQNALDKDRIKACAIDFRENRNLPKALIECFENQGIDVNEAILLWHDTMPFGGPTDAYRGEWLTLEKRFYKYEIYLDPKSMYVEEIELWEDVTELVEICEHKPGKGKTIGWLSIEVLNELNT
jgi:hypothetical protein